MSGKVKISPNDRRLLLNLWVPILEEATFGGQILEKECQEARFISRMRPDSVAIVKRPDFFRV